MHLTLLTPEKKVFSGETNSIQVPGTDGLMGILNNHAPIISSLKTGVVKYSVDNKPNYIFITGGYLEFYKNNAVILVEAAEKPEEINEERAKKALLRAKERVSKKNGDIDRAKLAIIRAIGRQKVLKSLRD